MKPIKIDETNKQELDLVRQLLKKRKAYWSYNDSVSFVLKAFAILKTLKATSELDTSFLNPDEIAFLNFMLENGGVDDGRDTSDEF